MQEPAPEPKLVEERARELVQAQVLAAPAEKAATIAAEEKPVQLQVTEANQEPKD